MLGTARLDTAQGNALGTLASCARHIAVLTGTLLGGYALDLFNILFRLEPSTMLNEGFEHGEAGVRAFTEAYGLLEKITVIEPADNACSEARVTTRFRHRQRSNVNVKFFYYAGTMQETCLRLMGKKLLVSLAMEGKFAADGLQAMDEGDDILMAMARELVTEKGIGETADAVWKRLVEKQTEVFGVRTAEDSLIPIETEASPGTMPEIVARPIPPIPKVVTQLVMFDMSQAVQRHKSSNKLPTARVPSPQLGLFGS